MPCRLLLLLEQHLSPPGFTTGYCIAIIPHTESFPSTYPSSRWSCNCFEQTSLHLRVFCALWELSEQGQYAVPSYILVHKGLPLHSVDPPRSARLCRTRRIFQLLLQTSKWWLANRSTSFDMNVQHWTEQVSRNYVEINKWLLDQRNLCIRCTCANLRWKEVFMVHSALLHHKCSSIPSRLRPNMCIEVSLRILDSLVLTFWQGITNFFHGFRVQCTWVWVRIPVSNTGSNNFNLNMHTVSPSGIHSSTQFASWGLTCAGSTPE